jgi:hypothetical protein
VFVIVGISYKYVTVSCSCLCFYEGKLLCVIKEGFEIGA